MLLPAWLALLLLPLAKTGASYDERDLACELGDARIPTTSVCDGVPDCASDADGPGNGGLSDESEEICAPAPYLTRDASLVASEVTNRSLVLSWSKATTKVSNYSLELAGYFVTGRSEPHSFDNTVSRRLLTYQVEWLKPWTHYTLIVRPFYTDTGKPHSSYKIGRAASVAITTLPSTPEVTSLVSVVSAQHRNVVLNILGPSSWNSQPFAFHVRWEPTSPGRGLRGELHVSLDADWSPEENTVNATLPLQGGWDYLVYVSAIGRGASGTTLKGPELKVEVSVPLDSYEISVYGVRSNSAVLSWRSSHAASVFKVTVAEVSPQGITDSSHRYQLDGTHKASSRHTITITGLRFWSFYVAILEGCTADACNESVNATFITLPNGTPRSTVTRVASTSTSSFEIAWTFPQNDSRLYEGFRVQYCNGDYNGRGGRCFVAYTKEKSFAAQGLTPSTTYYISVSAQYRNSQGALWLGPRAMAWVKTWGHVPVLTFWHHDNTDDGFSTSLFRWVCSNSSVSYFQYRLDGRGSWATCNDSADCDVTVDHKKTAARTSGYLRLTHHRINRKFNVGIRGCNGHGCGLENTVQLIVRNRAFLNMPAVSAMWKGDGAHLEHDYLPHDPARGLEILWKCGTGPDIYRRQILQQKRQFLGEMKRSQTQIDGFPDEAQDCELSVAEYEQRGEETYYGPRAQPPLA